MAKEKHTLLTNHILKGAGAFRTVFFLPNLLGGLALGYIWKFIFDVIFSQLLFGKDGVLPIEALTYMTQHKSNFCIASVNDVAVGRIYDAYLCEWIE